MLSDALREAIEQETGETVRQTRRASGGSINQAAQVELSETGPCFLKWNSRDDVDMFVKEVKGLEMLRSADTDLVIPEVLAQGVDGSGTGYLLIDYIPQQSAQSGSAEQFGAELATLHQHTADQYGLDHDNYIGRLPQSNTKHDDWIDFFVEERISPLVKMAADSGKISSSTVQQFEQLYRELPGIMPEEPPSLMHGDLWGGNFMYTTDGKASIYDPAVYYGHREMEMAFTHMFGGFSGGFYRGYNDAWPLESGFNQRKDVYNLYHLLTHTNMFGGSYARQAESTLRKYV